MPELRKDVWLKDYTFGCFVALAASILLFPTSGMARQMMCFYDYITHLTTYEIDDQGVEDGPIAYRYTHTVSPIGGEDMFLFKEAESSEREGAGQLEFIMERLYFDPSELVKSIVFVDFARPAFKELQFPDVLMEQSSETLTTPLVVWSCHRTD